MLRQMYTNPYFARILYENIWKYAFEENRRIFWRGIFQKNWKIAFRYFFDKWSEAADRRCSIE